MRHVKPRLERPDEGRQSVTLRAGGAIGISVLGVEAGCGKSALMAGVAATLRQQGVAVRAVKPICSGPQHKAEAEIAFLCSVTATPRNYPVSVLGVPAKFTLGQWQTSLSAVLSSANFTFVEGIGGVASVIAYDGTEGECYIDSAELASDLGFPCILVARHRRDCIEKLIMANSYLTAQKLPVLGFVTVETEMGEGRELEALYTRSSLELLFMARTGRSYLGCLKFSPSISVLRSNQGNIIKMTEGGVDLLTIRKGLERHGFVLPVAK